MVTPPSMIWPRVRPATLTATPAPYLIPRQKKGVSMISLNELLSHKLIHDLFLRHGGPPPKTHNHAQIARFLEGQPLYLH